jgi:hypothetical protein
LERIISIVLSVGSLIGVFGTTSSGEKIISTKIRGSKNILFIKNSGNQNGEINTEIEGNKNLVDKKIK